MPTTSLPGGHLLGLLSNDASLLPCQIQRLRVELGARDAIGIGHYTDDEVLVTKRPGTDRELDEMAEERLAEAMAALFVVGMGLDAVCPR